MKLSNNCWLCEGWSIVEFKFDPKKDFKVDGSENTVNEKSLCFVHLSIDEFKGDLMKRCEDGIYRIRRMLPPKKVEYYYSISETPMCLKE
jgi:hypothetical protein